MGVSWNQKRRQVKAVKERSGNSRKGKKRLSVRMERGVTLYLERQKEEERVEGDWQA